MANNPYLADPALVGKLEALLGNYTALAVLGHELASQASEVLAQIAPPADGPTQREIAMKYLAVASNQQLRADLCAARGERSASCFKTKLHHDLKARNGHARVNGNGAAHAA